MQHNHGLNTTPRSVSRLGLAFILGIAMMGASIVLLTATAPGAREDGALVRLAPRDNAMAGISPALLLGLGLLGAIVSRRGGVRIDASLAPCIWRYTKKSKRRSNIRLYVSLAFVGLLTLAILPAVDAARPLTAGADSVSARQHLQQAWQRAGDVGRYQYRSTVLQTTHPTLRLENAGRHPKTKRMTVAGTIDRPNETMQMKLWSPGSGRDGIDLKVEGGRAYGRIDADADWTEI